MPPNAFELEINSLTKWLSTTFTGAEIVRAVVPGKFSRPCFFVETPRSADSPDLPQARFKQRSCNVRYFGRLDQADWTQAAVTGRLEAALAAVQHLIPRIDEAGSQVGVIRILECPVEPAAGTDTDLVITIRWRRLVWDEEPAAETVQNIHFRQESGPK